MKNFISKHFRFILYIRSRCGAAFVCLGRKPICQCLILLHVNWNVYIGLCKCTVFWLLVNFIVNLFTQPERLILTLHGKKSPFHSDILLYGSQNGRIASMRHIARIAQRPIQIVTQRNFTYITHQWYCSVNIQTRHFYFALYTFQNSRKNSCNEIVCWTFIMGYNGNIRKMNNTGEHCTGQKKMWKMIVFR